MKVSEAIQRVQSLYSKGVQSDDSRLEERHIYNKLLSGRAKLLTQKANKKQKISQWNYQLLPCIELIEAQKYECPCLPPVGCKILRSKHKLPQILTSLNSHLIRQVTSIDGSIEYAEISWLEYKHKKGSRYTKTKPDFFIRDNYLFLTYKSGPKVVSLEGVFQNPEDAYSFPSYCEDEDCVDCTDCESPLNREFVLDNGIIDTLIEMSTNELIVLFSQNIEDQTNNSKDTNTQRSK